MDDFDKFKYQWDVRIFYVEDIVAPISNLFGPKILQFFEDVNNRQKIKIEKIIPLESKKGNAIVVISKIFYTEKQYLRRLKEQQQEQDKITKHFQK